MVELEGLVLLDTSPAHKIMTRFLPQRHGTDATSRMKHDSKKHRTPSYQVSNFY